MTKWRRKNGARFAAAALAAGALALAAFALPPDAFTEIDAASEIVVRDGSPHATRLAADELNFFLCESFGSPLPIVAGATPGKTSIVLDGDAAASVAPDPDGYAIEVSSNIVRIAGNTLFGVYGFLERHARARMYFPGELGTIIPKARRIAVPRGRIDDAPAFSVRRYGGADGAVPCELLGEMDETAFKCANRNRLRMEESSFMCCHGARTHCLSPETWDAIYTNACAFFASGASGGGVFDAMPEDGLTWARHCRCDWCAANVSAAKADTGFATDLVWRRTAELAERLRAKFPAARVAQMSYTPYARIPAFDIPPNVAVFVARRGPWAEGTEIGGREKRDVRLWHDKLGRKVTLWNYPGKAACWNLELRDVPQVAPRAWAGYYRAVAPYVAGAYAESESDRWLYNYLNYYIFSRICWNPSADVEEILAEHHRLMFGEAAGQMAEFFDLLERCWMTVVATPYDSPRGPGVCEAPTDDELRTAIYTPEVLAHLRSLLDDAQARVAPASLEARRIALFRREYLEPLEDRINPVVRIGIVSDIHIGDENDASDLKRALRIFDAKKADAVLAAGDLTDFGLVSELRQVAAAWNEVFPAGRRSDGEPIARLFHYGDHDTALNFKVRQREVVAKGRWIDYIPHIGVDAAWRLAFDEPFEPVVRRNLKGCEFTLVHFLPDDIKAKFQPSLPPPGNSRWHVFSQHRAYRGFFARPGRGDEVSWDDGAALEWLANCTNAIAVSGHAHISAVHDTSFANAGAFAAISAPSLYYQIETWKPMPKGDHDSHQALFLTLRNGVAAIERLDVRTGEKLGPDWRVRFAQPEAPRDDHSSSGERTP